jgi:hypothetical protein
MGGWLLSCGKHKINFLMEFLKSTHCHPHFTTELLKKKSEQNEWVFNWTIDTVKNVGHDYRKMSENSIEWIKN